MSVTIDPQRHVAKNRNARSRRSYLGSGASSSHATASFARATRPKAIAVIGVLGMLALTSVGFIGLATANAASVVSLGSAGNYAVLAATTVTDAGASTISGELGVAPGTSVTGFPPGIVTNGSIHSNDSATGDAQADAHTAYAAAAAQPSDQVVGTGNLAAAGLAGSPNTLAPGVYSSASSLDLTGTLVLDGLGNPDAVFLFQAGSTLTTASYSEVTLINGAQASHVFWQIGSSATLGTYSRMVGTILAHTSITSTTAVVTTGRLIALGAAVTLDGGSVSVPPAAPASAPSVAPTETPTPAETPTPVASPPASPSPSVTGAPSADTLPVITSRDADDGMEGSVYEFTVTATGSPAPTYSISTGSLPPGLVLDSVTGVISGIPTNPANYIFDITATNTSGTDIASLRVFIARAPVAPLITSANVPDGTVGEALNYTVTASGYPQPTFAVSDGALPDGLSLDGVAGVISGIPTTVDDSTFMITASNGVNPQSTKWYSVSISAQPFTAIAPRITSGDAPDAVLGVTYEFTVTATGSPAPTFTLTGFLPAGLTLDEVTGIISGTPTTAGDNTFEITATNTAGSDTDVNTLAVAPATAPAPTPGPAPAIAPVITSGDAADWVVGTAYEFTVTATGSPAPTFTLTGFLPAGLTLDEVTGVITGTPTIAGDNTFEITATNTAGSDTDVNTLAVAPVTAPVPGPTPTPTPGPTSPVPSPPAGDGGTGVSGTALGTIASAAPESSPQLAGAGSTASPAASSATSAAPNCVGTTPSEGDLTVYLDLGGRAISSAVSSSVNSTDSVAASNAAGCIQASASAAPRTLMASLLPILAGGACIALLGLITHLGFILAGRNRRRDESYDFQI